MSCSNERMAGFGENLCVHQNPLLFSLQAVRDSPAKTVHVVTNASTNRVTAELASRRNEFVAALADEAFVAHAAAGGHLETLSQRLHAWGIPVQPGPIETYVQRLSMPLANTVTRRRPLSHGDSRQL